MAHTLLIQKANILFIEFSTVICVDRVVEFSVTAYMGKPKVYPSINQVFFSLSFSLIGAVLMKKRLC